MDMNKLAKAIIEYEDQNHWTDADFALASHLPVEKVHSLKMGRGESTPDEVKSAQAVLRKK